MAKPSMFVKLTAQPGKRAELLAAFDTMIAAVEAEPGTLVYSVHADDSDDDAVWIFELYSDKDALAAHAGSDAMKALGGDLAGLLAGAPMLVATTAHNGKGLDL